MEEEYMKTTTVHCGKPKHDLRNIVKHAYNINQLNYKVMKCFGNNEFTEEMDDRLNFSKIAESQFLELDADFNIPFEEQYYTFMSHKLDRKSLPKKLSCLCFLNTKKPEPIKREYNKYYSEMEPLGVMEETEKKLPTRSIIKADIVIEKEDAVLVKFKVFRHSFVYHKGIKNPPKSSLSHGVILHGSNSLADLKDAIICEVDYTHCGIPPEPLKLNKDRFPSGMFYINNGFYVDNRSEQNEDYSIPLKKWGKMKNMDLGETYSMESTLIKDLTFRVGYPYVYQHIGLCEHFIMVEQIRFINSNENHVPSNFPKLYNLDVAKKSHPCKICHKGRVEWIVIGSKRTLHYTTTVCSICFNSFFYINGEPIEKEITCFSCTDRACL